MSKHILILYFLFLGMVSAFSIQSIFSIPLLLGLVLFAVIILEIFKFKYIPLIDTKIFLSIYVFLLLLTISYLKQLSLLNFTITSFNHWISYFVVFFIYFLVPYLYFIYKNINIQEIYKYISWGLILTAFFALVEFFSKNFIGFDIDNIIYRDKQKFYNSVYILNGHPIIRVRAGTEESGHLSTYILMFFPYALYYYAKSKKYLKLGLVSLLVFFTWLLTFSANGWVGLTLSSSIVLFIYFSTNFNIKKLLGIFSGIIVSVFGIIHLYKSSFFVGIIDKITFNNVSSSQDRLNRWLRGLDLFAEQPLLGWGPGISSIKYGTGLTNFYLELLSEGGFLLFVVYLFLLLMIFIKILKLKDLTRYFYLLSFLIAVINYLAISNYWFPWFWTLLAIIGYHSRIKSKKHSNIIINTEVISKNKNRHSVTCL